MSLDRLRQVAEDAHRSSSCATTYLATFDPPTVKALLDVAEAAEAHGRHVGDEWNRLAAMRPQDPETWERWENERERLICEMSAALARFSQVTE